jgi:hypothetical protein
MSAGTACEARKSGCSLLGRTRGSRAAISSGQRATSVVAKAVRIGAVGNIPANSASTRSPPRGSKNQWWARRVPLRSLLSGTEDVCTIKRGPPAASTMIFLDDPQHTRQTISFRGRRRLIRLPKPL